MSAWDVAGVVGSLGLSALALLAWWSDIRAQRTQEAPALVLLVGLIWLAFCVARLCGAHA